MVSPRKVFPPGIPSTQSISLGAYSNSREDPHKESDDVGGFNRIENRTEVLEASMRRVEDMVCRICEAMDAIAGESAQVQNLK